MFFNRLFLKISQISQEGICVVVFFNEVAGPQNYNVNKKRLLRNLLNFQEHLVLLNICSGCF